MAFAIRTPRLLLREWRDEDAQAFAAMSADPALTEFLLPPSPDWAARARRHWDEQGFGQFVVELPGERPFIGVIGLDWLRWAVPFAPAVEAAWRLAPSSGGRAMQPKRRARHSKTDFFGWASMRSSPLPLSAIVARAVLWSGSA
jgi:RimJ/RimL family protein N-acetyltransferase